MFPYPVFMLITTDESIFPHHTPLFKPGSRGDYFLFMLNRYNAGF
ncbi:hypothetical protein SAMN05192573_11774 [Mucilaginibacter gossypii]|uniref:Uncharacterized protein n=1 Tax=Mucilaginibacter gossypii TaxID=551996 RepID=A0A1G8IQD0_9SPHI|nr:hypothetical protein SAMN05192573_11774 [Mucilaginibacter gossypii]